MLIPKKKENLQKRWTVSDELMSNDLYDEMTKGKFAFENLNDVDFTLIFGHSH